MNTPQHIVPPFPPQPPPPQRHPIRRVLLAAAGGLAVLIVAAAVLGGHKTPGHAVAAAVTSRSTAPSTASAAPAPQPVPSPAGNVSGSCDVSLAASIYGQDYLTATVNARSTGNIGIIIQIRVSWPLQGFAPLTRTKTVRVAAGGSTQVQFHKAASSTQISQFQDEQMASSSLTGPCSYRATITGTTGQPTS